MRDRFYRNVLFARVGRLGKKEAGKALMVLGALGIVDSSIAVWVEMKVHHLPFSPYDMLLFTLVGLVSSYAILLVLLGSVGSIIEWALERRRTVMEEEERKREEELLSAFRPSSPFFQG